MRLPDGDGLDLVDWMQTHTPNVPVAVITAHGNVETAVQALKLGAFDFISKPLDLGNLRNIVAKALRVKDQRKSGPKLLGESQQMHELREMVHRVARSQAPVHISGESGTGKELVARLIHDSGPRAEGPFVPVNCGAIPAELMESEFFGHRKGSFTGAINDKAGLLQCAGDGTLFLDEIADLPLPMQVKLLRVIQEKEGAPRRRLAGRDRRCAHTLGDAPETCPQWSPTTNFAKTSITGSTLSNSRCRPCASAATTSCCSPITCCAV